LDSRNFACLPRLIRLPYFGVKFDSCVSDLCLNMLALNLCFALGFMLALEPCLNTEALSLFEFRLP